jgi:hypothetical protein
LSLTVSRTHSRPESSGGVAGSSPGLRPGSSGPTPNAVAAATPVPPLAFPLSGFNWGDDSCEVRR